MSKLFFISDLHVGHTKILQFSADHRSGTTVQEHDDWLEDSWRDTVKRNSLVWVLGDVSWTRDGLRRIKNWPGTKHLIMGNHDTFPYEEYKEVFRVIRPGLWPYKGMWLSHSPIHPQELRGKPNVHGHVHSKSVPDPWYFNASVEAVRGRPVSIEEVIDTFAQRGVWKNTND